MKKTDSMVQILDIKVCSTRLAKVLEKIDQVIKFSFKKPFFVATVNPEFIILAQQDRKFAHILNSVDLAIPDGVGLRLAGIKTIVPGRKLVSALISTGYRIFYLGGRNDVARRMAKKYGGGFDSGHQGIKNVKSQEDRQIIKKINDFEPDILLVAYGAPWQEKWLWANRHRLRAKVVMGVGGTFDYLVGDTQLPPKFIERYGLEWLWRLLHQPWRWRRQLRLLQFVWLVARSRLPGVE